MLAGFAVVLGFVGTPAWPWFHAFLEGHEAELALSALFDGEFLSLAIKSSVVVFAGLGLGWWLYGRTPRDTAGEADVLETARPDVWALLSEKYFVDELYEATVIRLNAWFSRCCDLWDRWVLGGAVQVVSYLAVGLAWMDRVIDEYLINLGFDGGCKGLRGSGGFFARLQAGRVQPYLRVMGLGVVLLVVMLLIWAN